MVLEKTLKTLFVRARALPQTHLSIQEMLMADIQGDPQGPVSNVWAPPREVEDAGIGLLI